MQKPLENARRFTAALGREPAQSPIVPVIVGEAEAALAASAMLEANGYLVVPIRPAHRAAGHGPAAVCVFGDASGERYRPCRRTLERARLYHESWRRRICTSCKWTPRSMSGLFITSVGTGIGKTLVTAILCHQLDSRGPNGPRHQAGGFRLFARRSGQRSGLDPAQSRSGAHAAIDRGDRPLAIGGADFAPSGGTKEGRTIEHRRRRRLLPANTTRERRPACSSRGQGG